MVEEGETTCGKVLSSPKSCGFWIATIQHAPDYHLPGNLPHTSLNFRPASKPRGSIFPLALHTTRFELPLYQLPRGSISPSPYLEVRASQFPATTRFDFSFSSLHCGREAPVVGSGGPNRDPSKEYDFFLSNDPALDQYLEKFFRWFLINIL